MRCFTTSDEHTHIDSEKEMIMEIYKCPHIYFNAIRKSFVFCSILMPSYLSSDEFPFWIDRIVSLKRCQWQSSSRDLIVALLLLCVDILGSLVGEGSASEARPESSVTSPRIAAQKQHWLQPGLTEAHKWAVGQCFATRKFPDTLSN